MATDIEIRPERMGAVFRAQFRVHQEAARKGLRVAAEKGATLLRRRTPVGVTPGVMRLSWTVLPFGSFGWSLDNTAPHAGIVEEGARPHPVSQEGVAAIREWVERVGFKIVSYKGPGKGRQGPAQRVERTLRAAEREDWEAELDSMTWGIVWNLRRYGQRGRFFVRDALPELGRIAQVEVAAARAAAMREPPRGA